MLVTKRSQFSLQDKIVSDIQDKIESKILKVGDMIASEDELGKKYGVSRVTVRLALNKLEAKNLIIKKQGLGTFVKSKKIKQSLSTAKTIIDALREKNLNPKVKVLFNEIVKADETLISDLNLKKNTKVVKTRRLVNLNKQPYAVLDTFMPEAFQGVTEIISKSKNLMTTYDVFEEELGMIIKEAKYEISVTKASNEILNLLKLKKNSYCLKNSRVTLTDRKKPIELTVFYYPPETAKFEMILPRRDRNMLLRVK